MVTLQDFLNARTVQREHRKTAAVGKKSRQTKNA
jgi:hypothetical protein